MQLRHSHSCSPAPLPSFPVASPTPPPREEGAALARPPSSAADPPAVSSPPPQPDRAIDVLAPTALQRQRSWLRKSVSDCESDEKHSCFSSSDHSHDRSPAASDPNRHSCDRVASLLHQSQTNRRSSLMSIKDHHFFLSHKKWHTRDGAVHAQLGASIVDSMQQLNFSGFFDLDSLQEITSRILSAPGLNLSTHPDSS